MTRFYTLVVTDRWAHFENAPVIYTYVAVDPIAEVARVVSTIFLLMGTWSILWHERKFRYTPKAQAKWWFSVNLAAFVVILLSLFYVALHLALAIVWLRFLNLNIIDDIATKRNNFKVTMSVGYAILGSFILLAATDNFGKAREVDGARASSRVSSTTQALNDRSDARLSKWTSS